MRKQDKKMVARINAMVKKECEGCRHQDGKYCNWWKSKQNEDPPCQVRADEM